MGLLEWVFVFEEGETVGCGSCMMERALHLDWDRFRSSQKTHHRTYPQRLIKRYPANPTPTES